MAKKNSTVQKEVGLLEKAKTFVHITRPLNCVMVGVAVFISILVGFGAIAPNDILIPAIVAAVCINAAGNALNDYYDEEIDAVNKPDRALPSGRITPAGLWIYAVALFAIGNIAALLYLPLIPIAIAIINSVLLAAYASKLKKIGFFGNILVSYLVASVFAFGAAAVHALAIGVILAIAAFFTNAAREVLKDLEDVKGDKLGGAQTLPMSEGRKKTMAVVVSFLIIAILVSPLPYLLEILSLYYMLLILVADIVLLWVIASVLKKTTLKNAKINQRRIKVASIIGLLAFLVGTVPWL